MSKSKKTLALILAVLTVAASMVACSTKQPGSTTTSSTDSNQGAETAEVKLDVPEELDYGGATFKVLSCAGENSATELYWTHFGIEQQDGDVLKDAIYKANSNTANYLNIKFEFDDSAGLVDTGKYTDYINSGDDLHMALWIDRFALSLAMNGKVYAVDQMDRDGYVDLSKPWWYKSLNDTLSINNKLYLAAGYMGLDLFGGMNILLYNKQIATDNHLGDKGDLYSMVYDGTWTMDAMYEMMKTATKQLDGDGVMTETDQWGAVITGTYWFNNFSATNGETVITKDANDTPVFTAMTNERLYNIWDFVLSKLTDKELTYTKIDEGIYAKGHVYENVIYMFKDSKALFASTTPMYLNMLNDLEEWDYGIIPFPKYEAVEAGTPYNSYTTGIVAHFAPITLDDEGMKMVSAAMEVLNYQYYTYTIPAYINKVLEGRHVRDDDAINMLEMMIENRSMELGQTYWFDTVCGMISGAIWDKGIGQYQSAFEANASKINSALQETIDAFAEIQ